MGWKDIAIKMSVEENKNAKEISEYLLSKNLIPVEGQTEYQVYERVRQYIKKYRRKHGLRRDASGKPINNDTTATPIETPKKTTKYTYKNGEHTYEDLFELIEGEQITPEVIMKAHNLKPSEWEVAWFTSNAWQGQAQGGETKTFCQSKLTVKPKKQVEITLEEVDKFFDEKRFEPLFPVKTYQEDKDGYVLEVAYADPHFGLLSWRNETGEDYDLNIARQRFIDCAFDIVERCKGKKIKRIEFALLGDVLHTANDNQTTEKGTMLQQDGRYAKIVDYTEKTICDVIRVLKEIAPVNVTWVSGNHSRTSEYILMKCVSKTFADVEFDIQPNTIKHIRIGNALIGVAHGDMPRKNLTANVDMIARELGGIKFIEQHCGHYHTEETITVNGIKVRFLPTMCSSSFWEHQQGYLSQKAMISFLWSETKGIRECWINNI